MRTRIAMKVQVLTVLILLAALACYGAGLEGAGLALFFVGAVLELGFWISAIQGPPREHAAQALRFHR